MLIKSHEQLNQAVCEIFFSSQLSKMGTMYSFIFNKRTILPNFSQKNVATRTSYHVMRYKNLLFFINRFPATFLYNVYRSSAFQHSHSCTNFY